MRVRVRAGRLAAIGAAIGVLLGAAAVATPANAATYGCATFSGLTASGQQVNINSVALAAGDVVGAKVSPARDTDRISLSTAVGSSLWFGDAPATTGMQWKAPVDGTYNFGWALQSSTTLPTSIAWTFSCTGSSGTGGGTTVTDADRDGVADTADACRSTVLPDTVKRAVAGKYYARSNGRFLDGAGVASAYTVVDTGGCSAAQIAAALGLRKTDAQSGISLSVLQNWAATH